MKIWPIRSCGKAHAFCRECKPDYLGRAGRHHSISTKIKMREAKLGKPLSELHRMASANGHRGLKLSEEHRKHISDGLTGGHPKNSKGLKRHHQECNGSCGSSWCGNHKNTETKIHKKLYQFLVKAGYFVINEKRFGRFSIDCFVPELNIGFEADGDYWHSIDPSVDRRRDKILREKYDIIIVRFSEKEINEWQKKIEKKGLIIWMNKNA